VKRGAFQELQWFLIGTPIHHVVIVYKLVPPPLFFLPILLLFTCQMMFTPSITSLLYHLLSKNYCRKGGWKCLLAMVGSIL
jgi:hypothetical protein